MIERHSLMHDHEKPREDRAADRHDHHSLVHDEPSLSAPLTFGALQKGFELFEVTKPRSYQCSRGEEEPREAHEHGVQD